MSARVRSAMAERDVCHREPEFMALTVSILRRIEAVHPTNQKNYRATLLAGSGTAAVEAMMATYAPKHRPTLVISNGVYGERMARMLAQQEKPFATHETDWLEPVDVGTIVSEIDSERFGAVAIVHHETTTGTLNPLDGIAAACAQRDVPLLIDAVSSFGGEELPLDRWRPLAVAGTANKCLHGAPGLSFVLVDHGDERAFESHAPVLYLDVTAYAGQQQDGSSPFTLPTHVALALDRALDEHAVEGGWKARRAHFQARSTVVREGLKNAGFQLLIPEVRGSSMLSAFELPIGVGYEGLHAGLKSRGYIVYAGQGRLSDRIMRVATMGHLTRTDIQGFVSAVDEILRPHGR